MHVLYTLSFAKFFIKFENFVLNRLPHVYSETPMLQVNTTLCPTSSPSSPWSLGRRKHVQL